jgi:REP element-mobilizing transposase RayT
VRGQTVGLSEFAARYPVHATWRLVSGVASLRRDFLARIARGAIRQSQSETFRVVEFSVQTNHLHLLVEANGAAALADGMQTLGVRLALRLNRKLGRRGKLFATRYHARVLRTPRDVRKVVRYVLLDARHHARRALARRWIDPYSSAPWFTGWARPLDTSTRPVRDLVREPRPTAAARTWLLATGWRRHGPLAFDDAPASWRP